MILFILNEVVKTADNAYVIMSSLVQRPKQASRRCQKCFGWLFQLSTSQSIPTIFCTSGTLTYLINHAKFNIDWLRGFGLAGTRKSYVSIGKYGRPYNTVLGAAALARDF